MNPSDPLPESASSPAEPLPAAGGPLDALAGVDAEEYGSPALGDASVRELAQIPAVEVITRAAVLLMSAAAEKLGLAEDGDRYLDRDEARRLITALAGLYSAAAGDLGAHRQPIRAGITALQDAFHEGAAYPDPRGEGPGETQLGATRGRLTAD